MSMEAAHGLTHSGWRCERVERKGVKIHHSRFRHPSGAEVQHALDPQGQALYGALFSFSKGWRACAEGCPACVPSTASDASLAIGSESMRGES